ncbi:glycosyltransferase family 1 protein [Leifsonia bigeumensis]|uniref:glycogen phosphorylase n=1 Tax=Leifsonella bigeumensis TaxID=433643 RepID=A0ABP7FJ95_9MICO
MKAIRRFTVQPVLPESLDALDELATNLRWSWHLPTRELFEQLSPPAWEATGHDPIAVLGTLDAARIAELADDERLIARANALRDDLHDYLGKPRWYQSLPDGVPQSIAYLSPEFGIAAALPQYSGGLGILAGDHLKSASDLGVPVIAAGLFYRSGYFAQAISSDGWQQESYPVLDPDGLPLTVLRHPDGTAARVVLALPDDRALHARIWQVAVGRVTLLLLDSDIPENEDSLRSVTDRLYGGGGEHRLLQELLLGIGGVRAIDLHARLTGTPLPEVFHTNEGHAGFLGLERISNLIGGGLNFAAALEVVRASTVFTTHTPVPAGIDRFEADLVERYFSTSLLPGVAVADVLALGAEDYEGGTEDTFNMAVMGLRLAQRANGVSKLHGEVSRRMFGSLWPGFDSEEVPIASITNGVHAPTWTDRAVTRLAAEKLETTDTTACDWLSDAVTDADLWSLRGELRAKLVDDARRRMTAAWTAQHPGAVPPAWYSTLLDPDTLTIGFARRVPTYKRLTLMLHDEDRLRSILLDPERPVQIVVAGKSHPADDEGKRLIQRLVRFANEPAIRGRLVFLPNYDIGMAQTLYPGTDVWLNNPLRPLEACGTSGMKAAMNGSLNLSILDGWWAEFFDGENGWAIPSADAAGDSAERDALEAGALYDLIEHQVAPRFYDRGEDGVPTRWVESIRHTLSTLSPQLSADRMVREYVERLYVPAAASTRVLTAEDAKGARELAAWRQRIVQAWPAVSVGNVESGGVDAVPQVGDELHVRAQVHLGGLSIDDVTVQLLHGSVRSDDDLLAPERLALEPDESGPSGAMPPDADSARFAGSVPLAKAGSFGYTVRVLPRHPGLTSGVELGLVAVAPGSDRA